MAHQTELTFHDLWDGSHVAPSFGIMKQTRTLHGNIIDSSSLLERPFFYTPVYVLYDAILAVQSLQKATKETLHPILFSYEVGVALAAISGAGRNVASPESHFPGPEASFYKIVTSMRERIGG